MFYQFCYILLEAIHQIQPATKQRQINKGIIASYLTTRRIPDDMIPRYSLTSSPFISPFDHSTTATASWLFFKHTTPAVTSGHLHQLCLFFGSLSCQYLHHWTHHFLQVSVQMFSQRSLSYHQIQNRNSSSTISPALSVTAAFVPSDILFITRSSPSARC